MATVDGADEGAGPSAFPDMIDVQIYFSNDQSIYLPMVQSQETLHALKQALFDFQETAFMTTFQFNFLGIEDNDGMDIPKEVADYGEFAELSTFLEPSTKLVKFRIVEESYTLNKIQDHLRRFREVCQRPHLLRAATPKAKRVSKSTGKASEDSAVEYERRSSTDSEYDSNHETTTASNQPHAGAADAGAKKQLQQTANSALATLPSIDEVTKSSSNLSSYFEHGLLLSRHHSHLFTADYDLLPLGNTIKNLAFTGWNPPPSYRKLQGDLAYLEVQIGNEGTVYLTATARGFYINKSNRTHFDPSPIAHPHCAHSLFATLLGYSAALRDSWLKLCTASNNHHQQQKRRSAAASSGGDNQQPPQQAGVFDNIVRIYTATSADRALSFLSPQTWLLPATHSTQGFDSTTTATAAVKAMKHTYDAFRTQEALADIYGVEELGAPREWNDEIQSIRSLKAYDFNEKILKARLEYRIVAEFTEACKKIVVAISEGSIAPLSYGATTGSGNEAGDIYVYNNIFFSRAEDAKDVFKIIEGEEGARKANTRDVFNQRLVRSLDIAGLHTVLCTIIDFKGIRYVAQSIIPGILQQGDNGALLLYGVMDEGKSITIKNRSLGFFEEIGGKLHLAKRHVPQVPFPAGLNLLAAEGDDDSGMLNKAIEEATLPVDSLNKLLQSGSEATAGQTAPIRVNEEDSVALVSFESKDKEENCDSPIFAVPHIGCIEAKIIQGTDGRAYLLEVMRLTPRDANYVSCVEKNPVAVFASTMIGMGSGRIDEEHLSQLDESVKRTYLLRPELLAIYRQRQVNMKRQALLDELLAQKKPGGGAGAATAALKATEVEETGEINPTVVEEKKEDLLSSLMLGAAEGEDESKTELTIVKEDMSSRSSGKVVSAEEAAKQQASLLEATELSKKLQAITMETLEGLDYNVNVFLSPPLRALSAAGVEAERKQQMEDEEKVRELSSFLYDLMLPTAIAQIRQGDVLCYDGNSLVSYLHRSGINLRYLGRLALLAQEQERDDQLLYLEGKQRLQSMPLYFFDLCLIEMIARSVKHYINGVFREKKQVAEAPAAFLAKVLSTMLSLVLPSEAAPSTMTTAAEGKEAKSATAASTTTGKLSSMQPQQPSSSSSLKRKKRKGAAITTETAATRSENDATLTFWPEQESVNSSEIVAAIHQLMTSRFLFPCSLFEEEKAVPAGQGKTGEEAATTVDNMTEYMLSKKTLVTRLSSKATVLLRRICQQCGIVLAARDYQSSRLVVRAEDVVSLVPKVIQTSESPNGCYYLPEIADFLSLSQQYLQAGQAVLSFECVQQALSTCHQIVGPQHAHSYQVLEQMSSVLTRTADSASALLMARKALNVGVHLFGLDHEDVIQYHLQLVKLFSDSAAKAAKAPATNHPHLAANHDIQMAFDHLMTSYYLITTATCGLQHPSLSLVYQRLAHLYDMVADYESSLVCYHRARMYLHDLVSSEVILLAIADLCIKTLGSFPQRMQEAVTYTKHAYKIFSEILPREDARVLEVKMKLEKLLRMVPSAAQFNGHPESSTEMDSSSSKLSSSGSLPLPNVNVVTVQELGDLLDNSGIAGYRKKEKCHHSKKSGSLKGGKK